MVSAISASATGGVYSFLPKGDGISNNVDQGTVAPSAPPADNIAPQDNAPAADTTQSNRQTRVQVGTNPQQVEAQKTEERQKALREQAQEESRKMEENQKAVGEQAQLEDSRKAELRKKAQKKQDQADEARRQAFDDKVQQTFGKVFLAQSQFPLIGKHANVTA